MDKLIDLRFVIGLFFTIIGVLLLVATGRESVNVWGGVVFIAFGVLMIILSFGKDAHDEIV